MQQQREIDLDKLDIAEQARKHFDEAELRQLGENIKEHGLLMPLLVVAEGTRFKLVAGERRTRAMRLAGIKKAQAIVMDARDAGDTALVQFIENEFRTDLKPYEKAVALRDIKQKKGWNNKEIAQHLHMDASLPGKYLSLFDTRPEVQTAAIEDKIGVNAWYQISLLQAGDQLGLLAMYLSGMPAAQIASISRQKRQAPKPQDDVKSARVRCPLSTGTTVIVTGEEMSLEGMIEALQQALEAARRANKDSLDVKTAQRVWADKAKAGA